MPFVVNFTFTMVTKVSVAYAGWTTSLSVSLSLAFCSVGTHFYSWPRCLKSTLFCRHPIYPVSSIIYRLRAGSRLDSTRERRGQTAPCTTCPWWIPSLADSLFTRACDSKAKPARRLRYRPFEKLVPVSRPKHSVIARARKIDKVSYGIRILWSISLKGRPLYFPTAYITMIAIITNIPVPPPPYIHMGCKS